MIRSNKVQLSATRKAKFVRHVGVELGYVEVCIAEIAWGGILFEPAMCLTSSFCLIHPVTFMMLEHL